MFLMSGRRGQQIFRFGQTSNGESDHMDHSEPQLCLQAVDEMKIRFREPDSC